MGSTVEATDQDMLAPDLLPHPPRLHGQGRFKERGVCTFGKLHNQYLSVTEATQF